MPRSAAPGNDSDDDPIQGESQPPTTSSCAPPRSARTLPPPSQPSHRSRPPPTPDLDATPKAKVRRIASQPGDGFRTDASTSSSTSTQAKRDPVKVQSSRRALPATQEPSRRPSTTQPRRPASTASSIPVRSTTPPTTPPSSRPPSINKQVNNNPPSTASTSQKGPPTRQPRLDLPHSRAHSKPLKPVPPPPSLSSLSPPSLPPPRPTAPPRPCIRPPTTRPTAPPPTKPPSPRESQRALSSLQTRLSTTSFTLADPRILPSNLFRFEYGTHGNPTYTQSNRKPYRPGQLPLAAPKRGPDPSWGEGGDVQGLVGRLGSEEFVARVWAKDVHALGSGGVRREVVQGVEVWLMGREFPFRNVLLVGIVVGVTEKDYKVSYDVDDGTDVVECVCELPKEDEFSLAKLYKTKSLESDDRGDKSSKKVDERPTLDLGTLVRVVGKITEPWQSEWDRTVLVEEIQPLRDSNDESLHHILVARLHAEVYGKRFELDEVLAKITRDEQALEKEWGGSQATASEAGTPKKRTKLPDPVTQLDASAITFDNFKIYITHALRTYFLSTLSPSSRPSSPSPTKQDPKAPWALGGSLPEQDLPRPFTLADLESRRSLRRFAQRLARKNAQEERGRKKRRTVVGAQLAKPWIRPGQGDGLYRANVAGWKGGSASLLEETERGEGVGREEERERKRGREEGEELEGEALAKAVKRLFVDAIRRMRRDGEIVLAEEEEEEIPTLELSTSLEFRSRRNGGSSRGATSKAPWDLADGNDVGTPKAPVRGRGKAPWALGGTDDVATPRATDPSRTRGGAPWPLGGPPSPTSTSTSTLFEPEPTRAIPSSPPLPPSSGRSYSSASNTSSMDQATTESFQLVTRSSLAPLVLRLVVEELRRGTSKRRGVEEERIRELMGSDTRWEEVAKRDGIVVEAMDELCELGKAEKVGKLIRPVVGRAEWRSTRWSS